MLPRVIVLLKLAYLSLSFKFVLNLNKIFLGKHKEKIGLRNIKGFKTLKQRFYAVDDCLVYIGMILLHNSYWTQL